MQRTCIHLSKQLLHTQNSRVVTLVASIRFSSASATLGYPLPGLRRAISATHSGMDDEYVREQKRKLRSQVKKELKLLGGEEIQRQSKFAFHLLSARQGKHFRLHTILLYWQKARSRLTSFHTICR